MKDYIDGLVEARNRAWHESKDILARAAEDKRELDGEENESVQRAFADMDRLDAEIKSFTARMEQEREAEVAREAFAPIVRPAPGTRIDELDAFLRGQGGRSFDVDLRAVANEKRLIRAGADALELRDLTVGTASAGGTVVPTTFARTLYDFLEVYSGMRRTNATILTTTAGEQIEFPKATTHGTAVLTSEGSTIAESDPAFGRMSLNAYKYAQLVQVSSELLADSGVDLVGFVAKDLARAIGRATDTDYTVGNGTSKAQGVMTVCGTGVTGGTGQAGKPTVTELIDLVYSVNEEYRANGAQWLMRDATAGKIRTLTDTSGQFLWQPAVQAGQPDRLLGFPVITDPNVAAAGTSAMSVAFGDFSAYYIRDVGSIRIERSDEFAFGSDLATWRGTLRTDGDLIDANAIKGYKGGTA